MNSTQSFFTPEDSKLPDGTYIATGLAGVTLLAEYLDTHPETSVLHLLISDSTVQDTETGHGYLSYTNIEDLAHEDYHYIIDDRKPRSPPLTDEQEDEQEDIRHTNVKTTLRLKRAVRDIEAPLTRVFERVAPVLEGLMFLTYISDPVAFDRRRATVTGEPVDPRIAALAGLTYPSLTQLIFLNQHIDCAAQVLKDPGRFPALTHLHVHEDSTRLAVFVEHFPHLTHLLLTGATSVYSLPPDFNPAYPPPTWMDRFKETVLRIPHQRPPIAIPGNLTVIVQPDYGPMMTVTERGDFVCGNPGVEYDKIFTRLADVPRVHVKFPVEEDYRSGRGLFPLRRMIAEFVDRAQGGEGQWADPGPLPPREDWWWEPSYVKKEKKDSSEL